MNNNFLPANYNNLLGYLFIFIIVVVLFKSIDLFNNRFRDKILSRQGDSTILGFVPLVDKIIKFTIIFLAVATILQSHGYSITSLITGFGITGLAVGFGAQTTIANIFGSFSLLADKTYKIGDYIVINQTVHEKPVEGIVEDINLRSTKIRGTDGGVLIIPNSIVANGVVKNISQKENCHEN